MADFIAWSHSRRKQFMDCPKQFFHCSVARKGDPDRVEFVQSQAMLDGLEIDNALTARVAANTPLPAKFADYEGMVQVLLDTPGTKLTQVKLALDQTFKPCGYMDWNNTWLRAIYDVAIVNGAYAFIGDYKNGQIWLDKDQLKLFAAVGFHYFPEVETIDVSYIWLRHGVTTDATYRRRDLPDMWADLLPDVERMQVSFKNNHWPPEPKRGKATCKWCSVNKAGKCPAAAGPYGK